MQIGYSKGRYFTIQIDLYDEYGADEIIALIDHLKPMEMLKNGEAHFEECQQFAYRFAASKHQPN